MTRLKTQLVQPDVQADPSRLSGRITWHRDPGTPSLELELGTSSLSLAQLKGWLPGRGDLWSAIQGNLGDGGTLLLNRVKAGYRLGGSSQKTVEPFQPVHMDQVQDVKFDIELYLTQYKNAVHMNWAYKKNLFKPEALAHMATQFTQLLDYFSQNPGQSLSHQRADTAKPVKKRRLGRPRPKE